MQKVFVLLALLSMMLCACTESNSSMLVSEVLTEHEIYDFELLRSDWSKKQMEDMGLEKEVNELSGETTYSNNSISYIFFDYNEKLIPQVVDVHGEYSGPRGIRVGDTFDEVIALFPQDEDWRSNAYGVFYGQFDKYKAMPIRLTGYVRTNNYGDKEMTFTTEKSLWMRLFFQDDVLTHYSIYMIRRDG